MSNTADSHAALSTGNRERAARRARGQARRYAIANRCTRLFTLTTADQTHDVREFWARTVAFDRRLRALYPRLAWVKVPERHKSGAVHMHYVANGYVPKALLARLWGFGWVDARRFGKGFGGKADAQHAARYASKYVAKTFGPEADGSHRYEVRQGFQPVAVRVAGWDQDEVWRQLVALAGGEVPRYEWSSSGATDWLGPPVSFLCW